MENKINKALQSNQSKLRSLEKITGQLLEQIKNSVNKNAEENNIFEIINHLPGYISELEQTYVKMGNLNQENQKLKYFLES